MEFVPKFRAAIGKWMLLLLVLICVVEVCVSSGRGWGDNIKWMSYRDGLAESQKSKKPMMLLIHKTWCGACKALKPKFAASTEIATLSNLFVMVNTEDDEEPKDKQFHPDGSYIPRIFFLDMFGNVQKDFYNVEGNPSYKYFYANADAIVRTMKRVMENMVGGVRVGDEL